MQVLGSTRAPLWIPPEAKAFLTVVEVLRDLPSHLIVSTGFFRIHQRLRKLEPGKGIWPDSSSQWIPFLSRELRPATSPQVTCFCPLPDATHHSPHPIERKAPPNLPLIDALPSTNPIAFESKSKGQYDVSLVTDTSIIGASDPGFVSKAVYC